MEKGGFFPAAQSYRVYSMHIYISTWIHLHLYLILHLPAYVKCSHQLQSNIKVFSFSIFIIPFFDRNLAFNIFPYFINKYARPHSLLSATTLSPSVDVLFSLHYVGLKPPRGWPHPSWAVTADTRLLRFFCSWQTNTYTDLPQLKTVGLNCLGLMGGEESRG